MKTLILTLVATLTLLGIVPFANADDYHVDEDRQSKYAGTTGYDHGLNQQCDDLTGDCPAVIPSGFIATYCDHPHGAHPGGGINGIGGVLFCDILKGKTVTLTLYDELLESPMARITCPDHQENVGVPDNPVTGPIDLLSVTCHHRLGKATPSLTTEVPDDCWSPPGTKDDRADLTNIGVFMDIGITGTVTLVYE